MDNIKTKQNSSNGYTAQMIDRVEMLCRDPINAEMLAAAKRCLIDTVGVTIGGANSPEVVKSEKTIAKVRPEGGVPVPGRKRRADLLDAAFIGAVSGHSLELDDGYRPGTVHPGTVVIPALLPFAMTGRYSGLQLLCAIIAGYEVITLLAGTVHPELRTRGFHPTSVTGVMGAAVAVSTLRGHNREKLMYALGISASAAAGLFAFVSGGAEVKRLHAGHAAREGVFSALLAEEDVAGPPNVVEGPDGFFQSFVDFGPEVNLPDLTVPGVMDCYIKPYSCCRHIQPAAGALIGLMQQEGLSVDQLKSVEVETYTIASKHAAVDWSNSANAQLSFPYVMAVAARFGAINVEHFTDEAIKDNETTRTCSLVKVIATEEMDQLYPANRPARVKIDTDKGVFILKVDEALGAPEMPLTDDELKTKFMSVTVPVIGKDRAEAVFAELMVIDRSDDISNLLNLSSLSSQG